jgi:hypothetical protein
MATAQLHLHILPDEKMQEAAFGLFRIYKSYLNAGFEKDQAMALIITMLQNPAVDPNV